MKLKEIENYYNNLTESQLFEQIDPANDSPISTQDLVKIVKTNRANQWQELPVDDNSFDAYIDSLVGNNNGKRS
jgi:hypothetical protein